MNTKPAALTAPLPSFSELLAKACFRQVKLPVFRQGYASVLQLVATPTDHVVHGLRLHAPAGVYSPHETSSTRFIMDRFPALELCRAGGKFLEIGCGAGGISLLAARHGWDVTATDINPVAVEATLQNAEANGLTVKALQSDLFHALRPDERFDVVLFNQPFWHDDREIEENERALTAPGGELYERFMRGARPHLTERGYVAVSFANCSNPNILHQPGWDIEVRAFDYEAFEDSIRALFVARPVR